MFESVEFNTMEKMMSCYEVLSKDKSRHAYAFYIEEPKTDIFWVNYLPRKAEGSKKGGK